MQFLVEINADEFDDNDVSVMDKAIKVEMCLEDAGFESADVIAVDGQTISSS